MLQINTQLVVVEVCTIITAPTTHTQNAENKHNRTEPTVNMGGGSSAQRAEEESQNGGFHGASPGTNRNFEVADEGNTDVGGGWDTYFDTSEAAACH